MRNIYIDFKKYQETDFFELKEGEYEYIQEIRGLEIIIYFIDNIKIYNNLILTIKTFNDFEKSENGKSYPDPILKQEIYINKKRIDLDYNFKYFLYIFKYMSEGFTNYGNSFFNIQRYMKEINSNPNFITLIKNVYFRYDHIINFKEIMENQINEKGFIEDIYGKKFNIKLLKKAKINNLIDKNILKYIDNIKEN